MSDDGLYEKAILRIEALERELAEAEKYIEDLEGLAVALRERMDILVQLKGVGDA